MSLNKKKTWYEKGGAQPRVLQILQKESFKNKSLVWKSFEGENLLLNIKQVRFASDALKKSLPKEYISFIRLAVATKEYKSNINNKDNEEGIKKKTYYEWELHVKNPVIAARLKILKEELVEKILKNFNYRVRIVIIVSPSRWQFSGISLEDKKDIEISLPTEEEAIKLIKDFILTG